MLRGEKYQLLQPIIQGEICGKKSRGRPKMSWLELFQCNTKELFSAVKNKEHITMMIFNL
jgi:hypothetical protein